MVHTFEERSNAHGGYCDCARALSELIGKETLSQTASSEMAFVVEAKS